MAEVQPFPALRFSPQVDLAAAICPPFDTISPEQQRALHERSPHNAVRLELPLADGDPYQRAAATLRRWLDEGVLRRDGPPAFYLYRQRFQHEGAPYSRLTLFVRLRLEEWENGVVLPHEETFPAPKTDRLNLLRALRLNTSPIFLLYEHGHIAPLLNAAEEAPPVVNFTDTAGQPHAVWRIDGPETIAAIRDALAAEKLYVADGHHRYETALAYRDERRAASPTWTGAEPENFALAALTAADDPGLLILPIHRLINLDLPLEEPFARLQPLFDLETFPSLPPLLSALQSQGRLLTAFGLIAADSPDLYLLTLSDPGVIAQFTPPERSSAWRNLDATIATYVVLRHAFAMSDSQLADINRLFYTEDAHEALRSVREGPWRYALLLNPTPARRIIAIARAGERMPQKSTFFYPKLPTGLLFNPLD